MTADTDQNADLALRDDRRPRMEAAVALKVAGASYEEIAQALDYADAISARSAVERSLAHTVDTADRERLRSLTSRRLERLLRTLWPKASDPNHPEHLVAVRTALALVDRHARLYGLDAPTEVTVYTPAARELEQWVASVMQHAQAALPQEADVVAGEVLDV